MSGLAAILAAALGAQALEPVSAFDLDWMLDGVFLEHVDVTVDDFGEVFYPDGDYETRGRARRLGRYSVGPGLLCRELPGSPETCVRIWQNDRGQLFMGATGDRVGRNVGEVRFTPMPG